jgi:rhodanese-related sulfurtransferase
MILFGNINKGLQEYKATPGAVLVDVREVDEFKTGYIPGAVNAPLSMITSSNLPKDKPLFLYCLRGTRSKQAAEILKRMGYTVKSIGGISGYRGAIEK